jgi:transcription elongation factor Elf1
MTTMAKRAHEKISQGKAPGFVLTCPVCGEHEVTITLDLTNLQTCHCDGCGDDFAVSTAVGLFRRVPPR